MTVGLTTQTLQNTLLVALSQAPSPYNAIPADFDTLFPQAVLYAESRIYRDIPMLAQRAQNSSLSNTANSRTVALAGTSLPVLTVEGFALIVPTSTAPAAGTRVPYDEASLDVIDNMWPQESQTVEPALNDSVLRLWAMRDDQTIVFAPTAAQSYTIELTGLFQQTPLDTTSPSAQTYLTKTYPMLMVSACLVFFAGALKKNFGQQADNPQMGMSWEMDYQKQMAEARDEEMRRRGLKPDATGPAPAAAHA